MDDAMEQPARRERIGSRAWVRTVGLVGGGWSPAASSPGR
jgi:hypothetical protein